MSILSEMLCVCCDISDNKELILFMFGTAMNCNRGLMHVKYTLALCQNVAYMSIISQIVYVCNDISEMRVWMGVKREEGNG